MQDEGLCGCYFMYPMRSSMESGIVMKEIASKASFVDVVRYSNHND